MRIDVRIEKAGYRKKTVLENINFTVEGNSFTAVIGRNGSGKSTLIAAMSSLIIPKGTVLLDSVDISTLSRRERAMRISAMIQSPKRPHVTVRELVEFGRSPYLGFGKRQRDIDRIAVEAAIEKTHISNLLDSYADRISGGELRRAYFAMMLAQDSDVALLDEPTAFMDADYEREFFELSKKLSKTKNVIAVMHNLNMALSYADNILLLNNGRQVFFGAPSELLKTNLIETVFSVKRFLAEGKTFFA